jgi:hypothetical protein
MESCLAIARTKMENEYGASTDTQFAVQITKEVRIQNLDTFALKSDVKTDGKEKAKKGKVKRETFPEFMENPQGWNPSLIEKRGSITADGIWKAFMYPPALASENENLLEFSPAISWAKS